MYSHERYLNITISLNAALDIMLCEELMNIHNQLNLTIL